MKSEGFLTKSISGFTRTLESVISAEDLCRAPGMLQRLDPRVKVATFVLFIVMIGLARGFWSLWLMYALVLAFSFLSMVPTGFFLKRTLLFIPVFTAVIALPALFITPGTPMVTLADKVIITVQGARSAGLLFLRVNDSLSIGVLLILTTPWTNILVALRWFRLPPLIVDILGMTYRYIFLLLHTANAMFLARQSRTVGSFSSGENRRWLSGALATTMAKSQHLSEEVYLAMLSRGYQGEVRVLDAIRLKRYDLWWLGFALVAAFMLWWVNNI